MKTKTLVLLLAFCFSAVAMGYAADPNVGTWKLNEAKSKIAPGTAVNHTVVYTAEGDSFKCVVDGKDGSGNPTHNEWTGKFDGKDYAVTGDPSADTRAIAKVNDRNYKLSNKKGGKKIVTGTISFSADGNTRTLVTHAKDPKGKKVTSTAVYEKQ
jgi:hypothetical protein